MTDSIQSLPSVTVAECGRCGDGEDVCGRCDRDLDDLEGVLRARLRRCSDAGELVPALRTLGIRCGQLAHLVEVEGLGAMRCTYPHRRFSEWLLVDAAGQTVEGDDLVMVLADLAWGGRHVR